MHSDVTWKLLVLILVDMDRGDQDLYKGTKNSIVGPLFIENLWGCNNPLLCKICYKNTSLVR